MTASPNDFDEDRIPLDSEPARGVDLTGFDEDYEQAEPPDFDELPDGKYQVRVEKAQLTESSKGDPMIKWDLVVLSGASAGRHLFKNAVITRASLPFVKGDLKVLGLALAKFSDLPDHLESVLEKALQVTKRTSGEYTNVYFNRLIEIPAGEDPADVPQPW